MEYPNACYQNYLDKFNGTGQQWLLFFTDGHFYYWIDYKGHRSGITWLKVYGMNSIVACSHCFMKRPRPPLRLEPKELKVNLGEGNFIFVGSSLDEWAANVPSE